MQGLSTGWIAHRAEGALTDAHATKGGWDKRLSCAVVKKVHRAKERKRGGNR